MKKKIILSSLLLLLVVVAVMIPKETYQKWFGLDDPNPSDVGDRFYQEVYVKNDKGFLVGLKVEVAEIAEDEIVQKWNLLTKDVALVPAGYVSSLHRDVTLLRYEIETNVLTLHVNEKITESDGRRCIETIAWTFINGEIEEIVIKVDDEVIKQVGDYNFTKIDKKMGINFNYETMYLFEARATTVVFYEDEYILPVTYFHLEEDICSYIMTKCFGLDTALVNVDYDYDLSTSELVINLLSDDTLTEQVLKAISDSIALNFDVDRLVINDDESILYEMVFKSIET